MDGIAQSRGVSIYLLTVTLITRARFRLNIGIMMAISTTCTVLIHMILMAVGKLAQFGVMASHTSFLRQIFLVVRRKLGIEFCRMA